MALRVACSRSPQQAPSACVDHVQVSVPDGAPQRAKEGALPPPDQDVKYSYLWNCRGVHACGHKVDVKSVTACSMPSLESKMNREFSRVPAGIDILLRSAWDRLEPCMCVDATGELDQAARVVIATDNDAPGQALAEELSRRLGRERCWRVRWPGAGAAPAEVPAAWLHGVRRTAQVLRRPSPGRDGHVQSDLARSR